MRNEKKMWRRVRQLGNDMLGNYPTTLEEDMEMLKNEELMSQNESNSVQLRVGEKKVSSSNRTTSYTIPSFVLDFEIFSR